MAAMRHRRKAVRRTGVVAGVVAMLTVVAGCGGDGPAEGLQRVQTGWVQVDVPAHWVDTGAVDDTWQASFQDVAGDEPEVQLLIAPEFARTSALGATSQVVGSAQLGAYPDFKVVDQGDDEREQDFAHYNRVHFTYTGHDGAPYEAVLWGVADDDEHAVLVQLTSRSLDEELVRSIGDSIVVTGGQP